jgi:4-hydroxy-3-methylbut-2-enyl diphosphate reductase
VRLAEVAERGGARARLVGRAAEIDWSWLEGVKTLGITAGASAPEILVQELLDALKARFEVSVEQVQTAVEDVEFKLPRALAV